MYLILWFRHIVEQKFKYHGTSKPSALYFKIAKAHRQISVLYIVYSYKSRIFHRLRKEISLPRIRRSAIVLRAILAQIFAANRLVAFLPVRAAKPAALIAQKFYFFLFDAVIVLSDCQMICST